MKRAMSRRRIHPYLFALAVTGITSMLGYAIDLERGGTLGFEPFLIPIALSAVAGGLGPGIASVLLSALAGWLWKWSHVTTSWGAWDWFGLFVSGGMVVTLFDRVRSERRRSDAALRDREAKLRLFLENAPSAVAMYDRDMRLMLASRFWFTAQGLEPERVVGKSLYEISPDVTASYRELHQRCLAGAVERRENDRYVRADGTVEWVTWEMHPWYESEGGIGGLVILSEIVTERKLAADALRESEERWRLLVELLPDPLFVSECGRIVYMNQRGLELWRAERPEQILGRPPSDLLHPDERAELAERIRTATEGVPTPLWEARIVALDGTSILVESTANVQVKDGRRFAQVIVRDVSSRKAAEEQLRFQEALLRDMGRMAHVGGWTKDVETGHEFWTEEMPRIYDRGPTSPMTMQDRMAMFEGEARQKITTAVEGVLSHGLSYEVELPLVTAAGNCKWIRTIGQPVIEDGRVVGIRAACQDVTDQHAASERIHRLNEELEARVEARTAELRAVNDELEAFSYSVSHDLRAPLRTMDGFAEIVQTDFGDKLPEEAMRCIRVIRESAQRVGNLIDDLLAFSRLGREKLRPADVDMRALVEETLAELRPSCGDRCVEVDVAPLPACRGDRALLKQVWTNLLANAFKYTRPRHTARITVGCTSDGAGIPTYLVRDNGVGFDMSYADKLFGVFQRLHRFKDFEGTGVGLAIVQRIVSRHGGRVWCEAEEGQGATFFFTVAPEGSAHTEEASVTKSGHTDTTVVTAA